MAGKVSREEVSRRGRFSLTIAVLFVLILAAGGLPLPQRVITLAPIAVVMVVSVREIRRLSRSTASGLTRFGPMMAMGLSVLLLLGAVTQAVFYGPQKSYEDCMSGANTNAAQAVCGQDRQRSVFGSLMDF